MVTEFAYSGGSSVEMLLFFTWKFTYKTLVSEKSLDQGPKAFPFCSNLKKNIETTLLYSFKLSYNYRTLQWRTLSHKTPLSWEIRYNCCGNVSVVSSIVAFF